MSAESELELKIAALDSEQFERLVFDLVLEENPGANRLKPPDAGADMLVLGSEGQAPRVWQAKHYAAAVKWIECEGSLRDAIERYTPESVTFAFAKDLTQGQLKAFETRLQSLGRAARVEVGYWGLSAIRSRLQSRPHIRVRYFRHDEQVIVDIAAGRASHDPVTQAMNLEESFGLADPAFEHEVELLRRHYPSQR